MTGESPRALPLDGITVLDLGQIYQGPYAGFLLAMSGARVIKVEAVSLNLKSPRGRELFLQLATAADAVLCNFAPGVPERLGIDASTLWETNPRSRVCAGQRLWPRRTGFAANSHGPDGSGTHGLDEHHRLSRSASDRHWRSVLEVIGRADLVGDERYRRNGDRADRMDEVDELAADGVI